MVITTLTKFDGALYEDTVQVGAPLQVFKFWIFLHGKIKISVLNTIYSQSIALFVPQFWMLLGHALRALTIRLTVGQMRINYFKYFNVNTFLKSVSTSKSRVTYDLDTHTTTHKIIGVVGSPLYLATPVSTALPKSHLSL